VREESCIVFIFLALLVETGPVASLTSTRRELPYVATALGCSLGAKKQGHLRPGSST
jgi:hypothetical protein